jgi:hypothetical protein
MTIVHGWMARLSPTAAPSTTPTPAPSPQNPLPAHLAPRLQILHPEMLPPALPHLHLPRPASRRRRGHSMRGDTTQLRYMGVHSHKLVLLAIKKRRPCFAFSVLLIRLKPLYDVFNLGDAKIPINAKVSEGVRIVVSSTRSDFDFTIIRIIFKSRTETHYPRCESRIFGFRASIFLQLNGACCA